MHFDEFLIRPVNSVDTELFFSLVDRNRKRLEDFFAGTVARNKNINDTRIFISEIIDKSENRKYFPFVIQDTTTQALAGFIDIKNLDWNIPKAEVGFFIDENYEGRGIITKAVAKIRDYCFDFLKIKKLFLRTHEKNTGTRKVAEKNGFILEGVIRCDYKTTSGVIVDLMYYGQINPQ